MNKRTCSIEGCERVFSGHDLCSMHLRRLKKHGTTDKLIPVKKTCSIEGCNSEAYGRGWCRSHWKKNWRWGTPTPEWNFLKDSGCSIPGCSKPHKSSGLCSAHHTRKIRTGSPTTRKRGEVIDGKRICVICKVDTELSLMSKGDPSYCRSCVNEKARQRPYVKKSLGVRLCAHCEEQFEYNSKQTLHCSAECARATVNRRNWKHLQKRRARLRDAFVESFSRLEILERDGWICGICATEIDPEAVLPDQMSASIDHIIPIARGGKHERSNVQAAHLLCNVAKGVKPAA